MKEIWKPVKGKESLYEVSNKGRVRSWVNNQRNKRSEPKILKYRFNDRGYASVALCGDDGRIHKRVSRLVAKTFIPNPDNKKYVNHKNGIKSDNSIENLEWCTHAENIRHSYDTGLNEGRKGEEHHKAILTNDDILKIRELYDTGDYTQKDLSELYDVSRGNIGCIVRRVAWSHI